MQEGWWFGWAAVRAGDQVWMGGLDGAYWPVTEDPIPAPDGWADVASVWVAVAGHGSLRGAQERVWCRPATYRPADETREAERRAVALLAETLGGVEIAWSNDRRG